MVATTNEFAAAKMPLGIRLWVLLLGAGAAPDGSVAGGVAGGVPSVGCVPAGTVPAGAASSATDTNTLSGACIAVVGLEVGFGDTVG